MAKKITTAVFFQAMRVVSALDIKEDVKDLMHNQTEGQKLDAWDFGFEFMMKIFDKAVQVKSENNIYAFIGTLLDKSTEEIRDMEVIALFNELTDVMEWSEWKALFTRVAGMITAR